MEKVQGPWGVRDNSDPDANFRHLKAQAARYRRGQKLRRFLLWGAIAGLTSVASFALTWGSMTWKPWTWLPSRPITLFSSPTTKLASDSWTSAMMAKHLAASPNCAAARAVGLAPAYGGQPGYWPQRDRDNDGIACEPYPRRW
jgi:hypothetical protein